MSVYYNENDPFAATWLRELIKENLIARGDVDERSILDVRPADLQGYAQCHFFAGIGGWSYALRLAGWPDDKPCWTGSCPCQPFSAAGKGGGFDDERHLWPDWFWLIQQHRPPVIFGEQVDKAVKWGWLDLVFSDLEACGYACGAAILPATGVGAPHRRDRVWFVGDASGQRQSRRAVQLRQPESGGEALFDQFAAGWGGTSSGLADIDGGNASTEGLQRGGFVGDADHARPQRRIERGDGADQRLARPSSVAGFWSDAEWIACTDGKARPTQPGLQPLAHGVPNRVGTLRGAGNAIVPQVAAEFIRACA